MVYAVDVFAGRRELSVPSQNEKGAHATGLTFYNAMRDLDFDDGTTLCKMTKEWVPSLAGPLRKVRRR